MPQGAAAAAAGDFSQPSGPGQLRVARIVGPRQHYTGWAPKIAKLPYEWLISMVYGRYNELVNEDYNGL